MWYKRLTMPFYEEDTGNNDAGASTQDGVQDQNSGSSSDIQDTGVNDSGTADQKPVQSPEDNAKYAAARRDAEAKANADRERMNGFAKKFGYETFDDMEKAETERLRLEAEAKEREEFESKGMDYDVVKQAREDAKKAVREELYNDPIFISIQEQQRQQKINADIETLHKDFPETATIKTLEDLQKLPEWDQIYSYIERGYEMPDAYFKVNKNKVSGAIAKNAQQRTIADIQDRSRRGVVGSTETDNDTTVPNLSEFGSGLAAACGVNPKNVAKRIKDKLKGA